eukprot:TRINITY_DN317_c0_g1_i6.p1 TRINITY_DN317_c0_g1~~TRINITY_DN317_c0_g1_i6.p1  ORF type:complete len:843 (-),score=129.09 TRINITY_DN317_c0_g1_i6:468-2996(-)
MNQLLVKALLSGTSSSIGSYLAPICFAAGSQIVPLFTRGVSTFSSCPNPTPSSNFNEPLPQIRVVRKNRQQLNYVGVGGIMQKGMVMEQRRFVSAPAMQEEASRRLDTPTKVSASEVKQFIQDNYQPYVGGTEFLADPTERTLKLNNMVNELCMEEVKKGVLDVDPSVPSGINTFGPGYIEKELEVVVGLQTDKPLKRAVKPLGGTRMVRAALEAYNLPVDEEVEEVYSKVRKTHNAGVFDAYTPEMRAARKSGILTGLPDGYGRGRIIGDYRRVPLYGVDALIAAKKDDHNNMLLGTMTDELIRTREEVCEQVRALQELKEMAAQYGHDISQPAKNAREAVQWLYYAYLGAVKEQDGAAMSFGRVDSFLDIYFEKDLAEGILTEEEAQELIDQLVMKLRIVRQLRTPEYNALFAGDPTWVTAVLGGVNTQGQPMVTKTSYRILRTLTNLGPAPEPNITVLWHDDLPLNFKRYCAEISITTSSIQYESDALMNKSFGSDYAIACCVSAMRIGQDMQFFGARANLPKLLLYILNGGVDEITGKQVSPKWERFDADGQPLVYEDVVQHFEKGLEWLAQLYANTMNVIHYMHDKYNYERLQMALHDSQVRRLLAFGMSGLSVVADSLSAIKHAKVTPIRNENGIAVDFNIDGDFPQFGNDDARVDDIAKWLIATFHEKLAAQHPYRDSIPTLSALTITSNVVYGKKTGSTPDGRKVGQPFAPGANPLHGREQHGALASLNSIAQLPYDHCMDGISNTFTVVPSVLGKVDEDRQNNLVGMLDGYFLQGGHHINVNVLNRDTLLDAVEHPEKYPNLTIRVSGYAVHFAKLTREQQMEVIARTFHDTM